MNRPHGFVAMARRNLLIERTLYVLRFDLMSTVLAPEVTEGH